MFKISSFFKKFENISPPQRFIKEILMKVVLDTAGVALKDNNISVNRNTVFVTADPIIKSEIFLKKEEILKKVRQELSQYKKTISDIR
jgi:hypothetical protein